MHSKVCIVDDVWMAVGSDNLNRRSWTHDSELSCAVIDTRLDEREPADPAGLGDGAGCSPATPGCGSPPSTSDAGPTTRRPRRSQVVVRGAPRRPRIVWTSGFEAVGGGSRPGGHVREPPSGPRHAGEAASGACGARRRPRPGRAPTATCARIRVLIGLATRC